MSSLIIVETTEQKRYASLTGDAATDHALWHLSVILREISLGQQEGDGHAAGPISSDSKPAIHEPNGETS